MRKVLLQLGSDPGTKESISIEPELHFRTLGEFDAYFQNLFEKCPQTFKGYEVAFQENCERWIPLEEAVIGNWLSLKAANSPKWFIRPINQMHFMRDHVAHEKLETVADSVLQMRAYIEEEMDEIKQKAGEEISTLRGDISALRGEVWGLKLKIETLEKEKKKWLATEDLDDIEDSFPNGLAHSSPKKQASPKLQLGSEGELKPELFSTFVQFRVPPGTEEAVIPKHVLSCISCLKSVPVVYALTSSGSYEPCKYVSEQHDMINREPSWESFCIGVQEEDEPKRVEGGETKPIETSKVNGSNTEASNGTTKPTVVKHPKPWVPKPLVKSEENFPSFQSDGVDEICAKTEKMTFTEEFMASQAKDTSTSRPKFVWGVPDTPGATMSIPKIVWGVPAVDAAIRAATPTQEKPAPPCFGSPNSTQYSVASQLTNGESPQKQKGEGITEAKPEQETKPVTEPEVAPALDTPPNCNSCDKKLDNTHVHCTDCESFNCCQECFKTTNQTHPKEHTFELYIYQ